MKKKGLLITCLVTALVLSLLGACAAPAPTSTPVPAPTSASAPTKVIELKYSDHTPGPASVAQIAKRAMEMIEERSGGRVKITCYFGGSLLGMNEAYRGAQIGLADICYYVIGTNPGLHPLNRLSKLPFMGWPSEITGTAIWEELWSKFPQLGEEFEGVMPLGRRMTPPFELFTTKKMVRVPADLKGLKIIAKDEWAEILTPVGAAPVALGASDWYTALETGLADGQALPLAGAIAFKTLDLAKYYTFFGESGTGMGLNLFVMNLDSWNRLPPDIQGIFKDATDWWAEESLKQDMNDFQKNLEVAREKGVNVIDITPQEKQLWFDAAKPAHEKWIAENEARGLPARAIYEEAMRLIKESTK